MKKCIIIPDSFKGTMSALEFCQIAEKTVKRHMPGCEVLTIPVADGGEGTVDCFVCALGAEKIERSVCGPWQEMSLPPTALRTAPRSLKWRRRLDFRWSASTKTPRRRRPSVSAA